MHDKGSILGILTQNQLWAIRYHNKCLDCYLWVSVSNFHLWLECRVVTFHLLCLSWKTWCTVIHPVYYRQSSCHWPCSPTLCLSDASLSWLCVFPVSPAVKCFLSMYVCVFLCTCPLLPVSVCLCVCHVSAGQPIRKTPTCSGRTAVRLGLVSGFWGLITPTDCTAAAANLSVGALVISGHL